MDLSLLSYGLYVLLEFQATADRWMTVDRWMAVRVAEYTTLLYQHLIRERLFVPTDRLPPVFLVVDVICVPVRETARASW